MHKPFSVCAICLLILSAPAGAEQFRALVAGSLLVSVEKPEGTSVNMSFNSSALISLENDTRFLRGVELELSAPQAWLAYRGSLAMMIYNEFNRLPVTGVNDLDGKRITYEPLPDKIKTVYQIPLRPSHGLRSGPYASVIPGITDPAKFPVLFRLMPIIKGISDELENMRFVFNARPILSDEGAVKLIPRYPEQLRGRPFTVLIDDILVENHAEEILLKEGEHHLVVLSDEYRNESRRFMIEKAKILDLTINLQDPTPLIIFEGPENARIYLNNNPILRENSPVPVEPGIYEAKFHVGDYTITKTITVQRGKTYRVTLAVGIDVEENE
jgi:hypothetical protein